MALSFQLHALEHSTVWGAERTLAPVVHIYGRTTDGRSVCLHVHDYWPTLHVALPPAEAEHSDRFVSGVVECILRAEPVRKMSLGARRARETPYTAGDSTARDAVFRSVRLVQARSFYTYEARTRPFVELRLRHPSALGAALDALLVTMPHVDVFDAHVPYELQFLVAAGLHGMDTVTAPVYQERPPGDYERATHCDVEADASFAECFLPPPLPARPGTCRGCAQSPSASGPRAFSASGRFSRSHVVPSLVAMARRLGVDACTAPTLTDADRLVAEDAQKRMDYAGRYGQAHADSLAPTPIDDSIAALCDMAASLPLVHSPLHEHPDVASQHEDAAPRDSLLGSESQSHGRLSFGPGAMRAPLSGLSSAVPSSDPVSSDPVGPDDGADEPLGDVALDDATYELPSQLSLPSDVGHVDQFDGADGGDTDRSGGVLDDYGWPLTLDGVEKRDGDIQREVAEMSTALAADMAAQSDVRSLVFSEAPPRDILGTIHSVHGLDEHAHRAVHWSDREAAPPLPAAVRRLVYARAPPSRQEALAWLQAQYTACGDTGDSVDAKPPVQANTLFAERDLLTMLSVEVFAVNSVNPELHPDLEKDPLRAIAWAYYTRWTGVSRGLLTDADGEAAMLRRFVDLVVHATDADVLVSWKPSTLAHIGARWAAMPGNAVPLSAALSRLRRPPTWTPRHDARPHAARVHSSSSEDELRFGNVTKRMSSTAGTVWATARLNASDDPSRVSERVGGRSSLSVFRVLRAHVSLAHHDFEHAMEQIVTGGRHVPRHSRGALASWLEGGEPGRRACFSDRHGAHMHCASSSAPQRLQHADAIDAFLDAERNGADGTGAWANPKQQFPRRLAEYLDTRATGCLLLLARSGVAAQTGEGARTTGLPWASMLSRGSQYRTESLLARLCRAEGMLLLAPGNARVRRMRAPEGVPLTMEPASGVYADPVVVLDFASLYPSVAIAYNICYSTTLGRADCAFPRETGCAAIPSAAAFYCAECHRAKTSGDPLPCDSRRDPNTPPKCLGSATPIVTPGGQAFVPHAVREGVLGKLMAELLEARAHIKDVARRAATDPSLPSPAALETLQLSVKLVANVMYGYAGASYSGRMPSADVADAIVQTGRATLVAARHMIERQRPEWRARVLYGDTDSLFVALPGRSAADAARLGREIAAAVTASNPRPVTLRLDKVYHPAVLLAKKRYFGWLHTAAGRLFDAKGIETVRRDGCPLVARILRESTEVLFKTRDLCAVRSYVRAECADILSARHKDLSAFVFSREVRLGSYAADEEPSAVLPAAAAVAARAAAADPHGAPSRGERVPFLIAAGLPGSRLADWAVAPGEARARGLPPHGPYYVERQVLPVLGRVFGLVGADVAAWVAGLPLRVPAAPRGPMDRFFVLRSVCAACGRPVPQAGRPLLLAGCRVCARCAADSQAAHLAIALRAARDERAAQAVAERALGLCGTPEPCVSVHCPLFYASVCKGASR